MQSRRILFVMGAMLGLALLIGCSSADERLVRISQESATRQAAQSEQVARQSQQVVEATQDLVRADAQARGELIEAQRSLQEQLHVERGSLDRQHEALEDERRGIAAARHREPLIAQAISSAVTLIACLLPLALCVYLIRNLGRHQPDDALADYLIQELALPAGNSVLCLAPPPAEAGPNPIAALPKE